MIKHIPGGVQMQGRNEIRSTTILSVRRNGKVAIGGDGQVTLGQTVMKHNAQKIRSLHSGKVLVFSNKTRILVDC